MAGDWIPIRCDLLDDPAVIAVANATGLDEYSVVGRLVKLWGWANRHTVDGNAASVTETFLSRYLDLDGTGAAFVGALVASGWLDRIDGGLRFPKFDRWNSHSAKQRVLTARRVAAHKASGNAKGNAVGNAKGNAPSVSDALPTEEKRREEINTSSPGKPGGKTPGRKPGKPNPLFDAIAEVCGADPATAGGFIGKVSAALAAADPPYTPEDVREFGRRFLTLCPWAVGERTRPELGELQKHIGKIRAAPAIPERRKEDLSALFN